MQRGGYARWNLTQDGYPIQHPNTPHPQYDDQYNLGPPAPGWGRPFHRGNYHRGHRGRAKLSYPNDPNDNYHTRGGKPKTQYRPTGGIEDRRSKTSWEKLCETGNELNKKKDGQVSTEEMSKQISAFLSEASFELSPEQMSKMLKDVKLNDKSITNLDDVSVLQDLSADKSNTEASGGGVKEKPVYHSTGGASGATNE